MKINMDNEKKISAYVEGNNDCIQNNTESVDIKGERKDLKILRLPLDYVFFNIKNGRFAAEYMEKVKQEGGRELDMSDESDTKKIQELLLQQEPKQTAVLEEDLKRYGQKNPGIITHDGYVINGNRRMAVLKRLADDGKSEFGYIKVARLPKNISEADVWKIEAGIQLSRQEKLDYGPINTLLKLKEGTDASLSNAEIASALYGGFTEDEIEERLKRLDLIEEYLSYIHKPLNYKEAEGVHEHFIVLQKMMNNLKNDSDFNKMRIFEIQKIAFELIRQGKPQMEIRKIRRILDEKKARPIFLSAASKLPDLSNAEDEAETRMKDDDDDSNTSPVIAIFEDSLDIVEAQKKKDRPVILLTKAIRNLEGIEDNEHLQSTEISEKLDCIERIVKNLKSKLKSCG